MLSHDAACVYNSRHARRRIRSERQRRCENYNRSERKCYRRKQECTPPPREALLLYIVNDSLVTPT